MNSRQLNLNPSSLFKGQAGLVIRKILGAPGYKWTGRELALELGLSQAWVNRVLTHLLKEKLVFRNSQGRNSTTEIKNTQEILGQWIKFYHINRNPFTFYLKADPLKNLQEISSKENFIYALTGFEAANRIKKVVTNAPPMVYVWPRSETSAPGAPEALFRPKNKCPELFGNILTKLENVYDFIPVQKKANLIILKPMQKEAVFFESKIINGSPLVSPIQLFLDLYGLSRGFFIIEQLSEYWKKNEITYAL